MCYNKKDVESNEEILFSALSQTTSKYLVAIVMRSHDFGVIILEEHDKNGWSFTFTHQTRGAKRTKSSIPLLLKLLRIRHFSARVDENNRTLLMLF